MKKKRKKDRHLVNALDSFLLWRIYSSSECVIHLRLLKKVFGTSAFFTSCISRSATLFSNGPTFCLVFLFSPMYLQRHFLLSLTSLARS